MIEVWVSLGSMAAGGLVTAGKIRSDLANLRRDLDTKADKDVLAQIDGRLSRIESHILRLLNGNGQNQGG